MTQYTPLEPICCHSKVIPGSFRTGPFRSHSGVIPGSFRSHSRVIPGSFRSHSRVIPESFRGHSAVILGSFWGHSGVILRSFWGHSGVIFKTFCRIKVNKRMKMAGLFGKISLHNFPPKNYVKLRRLGPGSHAIRKICSNSTNWSKSLFLRPYG